MVAGIRNQFTRAATGRLKPHCDSATCLDHSRARSLQPERSASTPRVSQQRPGWPRNATSSQHSIRV